MAGEAGRVVAVWRYPVKSMRGQPLDSVAVGTRGLAGDRAYALVDAETGKVVSAKNPRRWPGLFALRSALPADSAAGAGDDPGPLPPAEVTLPDGSTVATDAPDFEARVSAHLGRPVRLAAAPIAGARAEGYWPDHEWLEARDQEFTFELPAGTFFDGAAVHLVTTASLERLGILAPDSRFDPRRFRPNFLIAPADGAGDAGFIEDGWLGRVVRVGDSVRLRVTDPTPRCVMTTLPQDDLPRDPAVLRAAVQGNRGNVGVYGAVERGGTVKTGDVVVVE